MGKQDMHPSHLPIHPGSKVSTIPKMKPGWDCSLFSIAEGHTREHLSSGGLGHGVNAEMIKIFKTFYRK
ncbi:unnamed protein product [Caretta caretta]